MAKVIVKSRPDIIAHEIFEFVHFEDLQKIRNALSREARGELTFKLPPDQ